MSPYDEIKEFIKIVLFIVLGICLFMISIGMGFVIVHFIEKFW